MGSLFKRGLLPEENKVKFPDGQATDKRTNGTKISKCYLELSAQTIEKVMCNSISNYLAPPYVLFYTFLYFKLLQERYKIYKESSIFIILNYNLQNIRIG